MKPTYLQLLALSLAAQATALAITPGTTAAVTLALTASIETGGIRVVNPETKAVTFESERTTSKTNAAGDVVSATTDYKTVITPVRYGNAQLLADLNAAGRLDGGIAGWSILAIVTEDSENSEDSGQNVGVYAVKKNRSPVPIEIALEQLASAEAASGKYSVDFVKDTETFAGRATVKQTLFIGIAGFQLGGVLSGPYRYVEGTLGRGEAAVFYSFLLDGALRAPALAGTFGDDNVAEGSLSIAAARVIDLETLGFSRVIIGGGTVSSSVTISGSSDTSPTFEPGMLAFVSIAVPSL